MGISDAHRPLSDPVSNLNPDERISMVAFYGSLNDLNDRLLPLELEGEWSKESKKVWRFICVDRTSMHWASTTGRIWFDGKEPARSALEERVCRHLGSQVRAVGTSDRGVVWLVPGRNREAIDRLLNGLQLLNPNLPLEAFSTANQDLSDRVQDRRRPAFGIILATPDEMRFRGTESPDNARPTMTERTLFAMGQLVGRLSPQRCVILRQRDVILPQEVDACAVLTFENSVHESLPRLVKHLELAGFNRNEVAERRSRSGVRDRRLEDDIAR
jgi:hypothetical protein